MKDFKPTHFIEQYVPNEEYEKTALIKFAFTECLTMNFLQEQLYVTVHTGCFKTVAIFKIKLKNKAA